MQDMTYLTWTRTRHSSGSAGSFLKSSEMKSGRKIYYKLSNYDVYDGIVGHECLNEIVVDRLLTRLGIAHLSYRLIHAKILLNDREVETYLCASDDFKRKGEKKIALDAYYEMERQTGETPLDFCIRNGFGAYIYQMLLVDFLIENRDRHGANIEILKNPVERTIRPAPLFDHGLSLLFSCHDDNAVKEFDVTRFYTVQCFVGGQNSFRNLHLIPREYRQKLPVFDEKMKRKIFDGLEEIAGRIWCDRVWSFMVERAELYEDFCNQG